MEQAELMECAAQMLGAALTEDRRPALERCCAAAKAQCLSRLRGAPDEQTAPVVLQACALLAAGLFLEAAGDGGEISSFTAGRLSVTAGGNPAGRAQKLKQAALDLLAPLQRGEGAFLGVRG